MNATENAHKLLVTFFNFSCKIYTCIQTPYSRKGFS